MRTKGLQSQLREMGKFISFKDQCNSAVSQANVGWHLTHNLQVINNVTAALEASNPKDYRYQFSFPQLIVFLTGRIPRGKAKAPKSVRPGSSICQEDLVRSLREAEQNIQRFLTLHPNSYFDHPYFKNLNRNETKKFLEIHTEHHLKIIREITS